MTEPERKEMGVMLYALAEVLGKQLSQPQLMGYEMALEDLPFDKLREALKTAMKTCKFMPAPVELRELAGADTAAIRAARAWATVVEGIRKHGYTGGLDARGDNGLTHAVVRAMGGWAMLCRCDTDELHSFKAKQFGELYEAMHAGFRFGSHDGRPLVGESGSARVLSIGGLDERRALPAVESKAMVRS